MTMGDFQEGTKLIQGTRCRFKWAKRFETFYEKFVVDFLVKVSASSIKRHVFYLVQFNQEKKRHDKSSCVVFN